MNLTPELLREAHRTLAEFPYELRPVERGYANRTLYVNLSTNTITAKPVSEKMKERIYRWARFWPVAVVECGSRMRRSGMTRKTSW